jgi:hypothetical protein
MNTDEIVPQKGPAFYAAPIFLGIPAIVGAKSNKLRHSRGGLVAPLIRDTRPTHFSIS